MPAVFLDFHSAHNTFLLRQTFPANVRQLYSILCYCFQALDLLSRQLPALFSVPYHALACVTTAKSDSV